MASLKQLIEVRLNGEIWMKDDACSIAACVDTAISNIRRKAAEGGALHRGDDVFTFRYTGEQAPRKNPYEKPEPPKKADVSVAEVERLGRANGLSYGYQSALMMAAKERNRK